MTGSDVGLGSFLTRMAEPIREAFARYMSVARPSLRFQRHATLAVATIEACAARATLEPLDLRLVRDAATDAAAVCRTEKPAEDIRAIVLLLEQVVHACDRLLGEPNANDAGWRRFLFAGADLSVRRDARTWQVRIGDVESRATLIDVAIDELLSLSNRRVAELTVQILGWFEHEQRHER